MIPARRTFIAVLLATIWLSACDRPAIRNQKLAQRPEPAVPPNTPVVEEPPAPVHLFPDDPPSPILWNPSKGAFEFKGRPLRAEKVWTFDGATDGFVATHGEVLPADGAGLSLKIGGRDTILRTPRGLNVAGANRSLVLVRLTRTKAVKRLDPTLYYSTAAHGEGQGWFAKPVFGGHPRKGDTTTMVFNMHGLKVGEGDWKSSIIDQVRLDLDDGPGGGLLIRQVAIAQDPGDLFPAAPKPAAPAAGAETPKAATAPKPSNGQSKVKPLPKG